MKMFSSIRGRGLFLLFLMLFSGFYVCAQSHGITKASGILKKSDTGEPVPYASVCFVGSTIGTMSDQNGFFELSNESGYSSIAIQCMPYKTVIVNLSPNKENLNLEITLESDVFNLNTVVVKPNRKTKKYTRKNNPAVELARNVIAHKNDNRPVGQEQYKLRAYEKLIMSLDRFDFNLDSSKFWHNFAFIKDYVDTSKFNQTPVLTVSLRESIYDEYYRKSPRAIKKLIHQKNMQGVDKILDREGLGANLESMLQSVDIFSDNMEILLNSFVSPLSSTLAISYYKYYIMDTVEISGRKCVDLVFYPVNKESYGFTGHLYIDTDGSYTLRKYSLNIPETINLNFVSNLSIEQEYTESEEGVLLPLRSDTYVKFYIFKNMRQIYAHQTKYIEGYQFDVPDDEMQYAMNIQGESETEPSAHDWPKQKWTEVRPFPLSKKESVIDSLVIELERVPKFRNIVKTAEVLISGYIPTTKKRTESCWDFGPIFSFISWNSLEGIRLRAGGMTTANLSKHWFANGYVAFGTKDLRVKYNVTGIYSFAEKNYHAYESYRDALYISSSYDVEVPGQMYTIFERDNLFMSLNVGTPYMFMQYLAKNQLIYEKEWPNRISIKTWIKHQNNEAAGALFYEQYVGDEIVPIKKYNDVSVGFIFRFAPGEPLFNNRMGKSSLFNLSNDAPVIEFSHVLGYMQGGFIFNTTEFKAQKRFWLSSFGHIDVTLNAGIQWNRVPFTQLFIPMTNQSVFLQPTAFNMMRPMEFVSDMYASLHATYYLKGWILNRIPLVKKLKLREVVSFSAMYGTLSHKNNPDYYKDQLFVFPDEMHIINKVPYMELCVGIENIFKFIRIDYVRRLSYLNEPNIRKNGVRVSFRFTF